MLAAERSRELVAREGPLPAQAVAEALSAVTALETMGIWPGPRDPVSEAAVLQVRRRWARIQQRAKTRSSGESRLEAVLADLAAALNATAVPWMVIGGIAVIARGVR